VAKAAPQVPPWCFSFLIVVGDCGSIHSNGLQFDKVPSVVSLLAYLCLSVGRDHELSKTAKTIKIPFRGWTQGTMYSVVTKKNPPHLYLGLIM